MAERAQLSGWFDIDSSADLWELCVKILGQLQHPYANRQLFYEWAARPSHNAFCQPLPWRPPPLPRSPHYLGSHASVNPHMYPYELRLWDCRGASEQGGPFFDLGHGQGTIFPSPASWVAEIPDFNYRQLSPKQRFQVHLQHMGCPLSVRYGWVPDAPNYEKAQQRFSMRQGRMTLAGSPPTRASLPSLH